MLVLNDRAELSPEQLNLFMKEKKISVDGFDFTEEDFKVLKTYKGDTTRWESASEEGFFVILDIVLDESLKNEGFARQVVNRIQRLRKKVFSPLFSSEFIDFSFSNLDIWKF
jgi:isoleucyl-tRNA synthetase